MNITTDDIIIMTYTDHFLIGILDFFIWAKWLLMLAFLLTLADLRFGIAKARYEKEEVRKSRALRRTIGKIMDYIIWIVTAYVCGEAFGKPFGIDLLPLLMLLVIYGIEVESSFKNYFASKGRSVKVNFIGFFSKKTDIIEIENEQESTKGIEEQ